MPEMEKWDHSYKPSKEEEDKLWYLSEPERVHTADRIYHYDLKLYELGERVRSGKSEVDIPYEWHGPHGEGRALIYVPPNGGIEKGFYLVDRKTFGMPEVIVPEGKKYKIICDPDTEIDPGIKLARNLAYLADDGFRLSVGAEWKVILTSTKLLGHNVLDKPKELGFKVGGIYNIVFAEFLFRVTFVFRPEEYPEQNQ